MRQPATDKHAWRVSIWQATLISIGIGLASFVAARADILLGSRAIGYAPIGLSSGLILATLLLTRRGSWPLNTLFVFVALAISNLFVGNPLPVALVISLNYCAEAVLAAYLLQRFTNNLIFFRHAGQITYYFINVILSAMVASYLGAAILSKLLIENFWQLWPFWWMSDSLGMVLLTPLILSWSSAYQTKEVRAGWTGWKTLEGFCLVGLVATVAAPHFLIGLPNLGDPVVSAYLLFPLLLWGGLRFSQRFITLLLGFTCLVGLIGGLNGFGQFAQPAESQALRLFEIQIYLGMLVTTTLIISAMFKELKQTGYLLEKSESKYHDLFDNASIGIFHSLPDAGFLMVNSALAAMLGYETPRDLIANVTDIPRQLYVDSLDYQANLQNTLKRQDWSYSVNHYRRKDGSLMVGRLSIRKVLASDGSLAYLEGFVEDITERKKVEDALLQSETLLNETQAIAQVGGWEYDCVSRKFTWTREVYRIYGVPFDFNPHDIGLGISFYASEEQQILNTAFARAVNEGLPYNLELRLQNALGKNMWVRTRGQPLMENGRVIKVTGTIKDTSELKLAEMALKKSEEQLRLAMDASTDGLWDQDLQENYTYFSPGYCHMLGYSPGEIPNNINGWLGLVHPDDLERVQAVNQDCRENLIPAFELEMRMRARDGGWKWILSRGRPVQWDENGKPLRIIGTHVDITERKEAEQALRRANRKLEKQAVANEAMQGLLIELATHDSLTGLYNRRFMNDTLQREISRANREEFPVSVLMLDIDHFKFFNDSYGHESGDLVLVALSSLLKKSIRESDIACRYGGEEFIVILPGATEEDARRRAEKLVMDFGKLRVGPVGLTSTISIGLAVYPQHGSGVDELLHSADMALYVAKAAGRNCVKMPHSKGNSGSMG